VPQIKSLLKSRFAGYAAPIYIWAFGVRRSAHEYLAGPIFIPTKPDPFTGASIPQIIGHEFSGTIVSVGDDLKDYSENDRVAI